MIQANEQAIRTVVQEVLAQLGKRSVNGSTTSSDNSDWGVCSSVDQAVQVAQAGFEQLSNASMEDRNKAIECVRQICDTQAEELGRLEFEETKIGRLDHKIEKLQIIKLVPGTEFLRTDAVSGDHGLTVTEYAPFGVIGAITPVTHSLPTLAGNVINMVAAGNTLVVNPHPSGAKIACEGTRRFNKAIFEATGLKNLITIIGNPTIESAQEVFDHKGIRLLVVTGGPAVARAALQSSKRAIVAGPGNPPVVVDDSACLETAAKSIITGAAYDNNLLCIGEKEVFAEESIFDQLMDEVSRHGGYRLNAQQVAQLTEVAFSPPKEPGGHYQLNRDLIGQDPAILAQHIGLSVPANTQILYGETDESNPFVPEEQMMPFVPFVRARDFRHAVDMAKEHEHGFGHTAIIHSRNVRHMTIMGKELDTTLFIKNGPCGAGLGLGGEGYLSFSIATPTGEGVTNPLTFTRVRRCTLVDDLRII
ncbi:aldehyde dehydrogenase EutE [Planctomycetaceae bacterium]|jgi:aldehyde dehydrogenase|nr:aldehyde dehydrogenase EutE [Planctomycetaceae bacterium]MDC0261653.1 aldehyde dehydrogenase EutE [Planctomycetaceae bacterium]MDC0273963.1 aldehyde dehydrogenase EutE [Planctomycetaceae bacterium]MDC0308441.1 aldehyde dehydrogenase EutE [Planctomycetaceae bacterium]MDG2389419.1 aldehyde dehydrogenase EutE [Planctomycetaceae bacterium]